jgi:Ca2+-binding RTX toxin-like protein
LSSEAFRTGTTAKDASDRVIYNSDLGQLLYDADGDGAGAAVLFANVAPHTSVSASDFYIV